MKVLILISTMTLAQFAYAQQYSWQVIARPSTIGLTAVAFTDTLNGIVAGGAAGFYVTTDGGLTWTASTGATFATRALSMADSRNGWAAGNSGSFARINHTTDGGLSWVDQRSIFEQQYNGTAARSVLRNTTAGEKYSGPDTALQVETSNGGNTWQERLLNPGDRLRKVQFIDSLHGWINAIQNFILKTNDGGATWSKSTTPFVFSTFLFIDSLRGWATTDGEYARFFGTTNGGTSWDSLYQIPGPPGNINGFSCNEMSFIDSLNGWAFGGAFYQGISSEAIYRTTDGGHTWFRESIGLTDDFGDLSDGIMLDRYHGWAVAGDGRVLAYRPTTSVVERTTETPKGYHLRTNYPNPFNPTTTIEYELPEESTVVLRVLDVQGKELLKLVETQQGRGVYRVVFDASALASGTYFYELRANTFHAVRQMVVVR